MTQMAAIFLAGQHKSVKLSGSHLHSGVREPSWYLGEILTIGIENVIGSLAGTRPHRAYRGHPIDFL